MMKRSRSLSLILMGSLALGGSGCGSDNADEGMYTFTTMEECVTSGLFSEKECLEFRNNALAQTPRFNSREECERAFGDSCTDAPVQNAGPAPVQNADLASAQNPGLAPAANGTVVQQRSHSSWMPMMMGFMAGRFMSGGGMMQNSQGLYRDPSGASRTFRTPGGLAVQTDAAGRVTNPSPRITQSMSHNAKPAVSRMGTGGRGGFAGGSGGGS
jgi:uncharacterized protein YgiB involved in biofilm formation